MTFNSAEEYLESVKKQPPAVISNTNCPYCNAKRQLAQSGKNTGVEGFVGLLVRGEIANKKTGNKIPNMNPDELSNHLRNYIQHEKDPKIIEKLVHYCDRTITDYRWKRSRYVNRS